LPFLWLGRRRNYSIALIFDCRSGRETGVCVWGTALQRIQQQGIDANINTEIPDFVASFFKKAIDAGYGEENVMALVKVLQGDRK
jgi:hypothetical protein